MQVNRVILDPPQGNGHIAEGQGGQSTAGALLHPGEVCFTNLISQIV